MQVDVLINLVRERPAIYDPTDRSHRDRDVTLKKFKMMPKRYGEAGKEQYLAEYIRYRRLNGTKKSRPPRLKPLDTSKKSNADSDDKKQNTSKGDSTKTDDTAAKKREEERLKQEQEEKRRRDEEEERKRKEAEDRRRKGEQRRKAEEERRREEEERRGRRQVDEAGKRKPQSQSASNGDGNNPGRDGDGVRSLDRNPKKTYSEKVTEVEQADDFQDFWKWIHNGKKDDFGVSKKLLLLEKD
ncbi:vicilin-like seed storage protein At2g18540 [Homarus americanus]|uniref:vicilin-like seed storage protein At2g18540 n=1 Tax=Homarus americanus TaxID=6706 RepID=UPI001C45C5B6|nr:vicilin-like seed storage protein At2g18540 [Homarus americanus]